MSETFFWEEPPAVRRKSRGHWWDEVLPKVAERPGYWACIRIYENNPNSAKMGAEYIRASYKKGLLPEGTWEIRSAVVDGIGKIYVRYTEGTT